MKMGPFTTTELTIEKDRYVARRTRIRQKTMIDFLTKRTSTPTFVEFCMFKRFFYAGSVNSPGAFTDKNLSILTKGAFRPS